MAKLQNEDLKKVSGGISQEDQKYYKDRLENINNMLKGLYSELVNSTLKKEERKRIENTINRLNDIYEKTDKEWMRLKNF